jgi:hypothetical protein
MPSLMQYIIDTFRSGTGREAYVICPRCRDEGPGPYDPGPSVPGPMGSIIYTQQSPPWSASRSPSPCSVCHGRGKVSRERAARYQRETAEPVRHFGAIAISHTKGTCGWSWNYSDTVGARDRARAEVEDPDAEILIVTWNKFIAVAQDAQGRYHGAHHPKRAEANRRALRAAGRGGHLVVSLNTIYGPTD